MQKYICVLFLPLLIGCATYNTATGRNEFIFISTAQEVTMGRQINQQICSQNKVITAGEEFNRLNRIGQKLERVSDRQDFEYHFSLIDQDELNAFTVPGGYIYFYTGLLRKMPSDDAIAAVLAHEIGHCAAKHTAKKFQAALGYSLARNVLVSVLSLEAPQARSVAALGADGVMTLATTAYSRQDEYEADKLGIKYLYLAGFNLNGMIQTFDILSQTDEKGKMPLILRTHPFVRERREAVKKEIEEVKTKY